MTIEQGVAPVPRLSWAAKTLVLTGGASVSFAMAAVSPVLPKIEAALAHGPEDAMLVKMLVGVVGAAMVIGAPLTGFLADRIGLRPILVANFLLITIAGTAGMVIDDLHLLIVSRFLTGLGAAGSITTSIIIINTRLSPGQRPTWMGAYVSVGMLVGIVLQPVTGILGEHDWHWVFSVYLLGAPLALIAAIWFTDLPPRQAAPEAVPADTSSILRWFPFRFLPLGLLAGTIAYMPMIYVPFLLRDLGVHSPTTIALVLTSDAITAGVAAMLYGHARRYLSQNAAFSVTFGVAAVSLLITALATNYMIVGVGVALFGIAVAWNYPNILIAVGQRVTPDQQGRAAGLVKASNYSASPLCILVAEPIAQLFGAKGVILAGALLSAVLLAIFLSLLIVGRPSSRGQHRQAAARIAKRGS